MHLGLRLLFAFLLITGVAAVLLLRVFLAEVKPSVREVMEDILVDCAHLLAEVAATDLATLPAGATLEGSLHLGSADGTLLTLQPLPYALPHEAASS